MALALATACSGPQTGEFGAGACSDGSDNDHDGPSDCQDADCQAEAVCGHAAPLREPDGGAAPSESGSAAPPPATSTPPDASIAKPPPREAPDAQIEEPDPMLPVPDPGDAGVGSEVPECPVCATDESCLRGLCVPNDAVFEEVWNVVSVHLDMPDQHKSGSCLDPPLCLFCPCPPPDPVVQVLVKRPGEEAKLALQTSAMHGDGAHDWKVNEQLQLRPEYEVVLRAFDLDGLGLEAVFECSVPTDAERLGSGKLGCSVEFPQRFQATISLSVQARTDPTPSPP